MIYIIISNVGMALMMIIVYARYSKFRLSSAKEIKTLRDRIDKQVEERKVIEGQLLEVSKTDSQKVEKLLIEIDDLRKEKEGEIKLRFSAEKQIELALQKTEEIQKRMDDWRLIQDAVMKDSKDAMLKVGNDLYRKLNESYKVEVETNKNLIGRISKNISDFFEKTTVEKADVAVKKVVATSAATSPAKSGEVAAHSAVDDRPAKKLVSDLVETMKAGGHLANKDYFIAANFDENKAKFLLCEVAFVNSEKLNIIDFKSCNYFAEYDKMKDANKAAAEANLKAHLDKYLTYLSNPKYRDSILKVMATTKAKFAKNEIIIALPTKADLQFIKENHYYEKIRKLEFDVMEFDGINNLVL